MAGGDRVAGLYAMFVEARRGTDRHQWLLCTEALDWPQLNLSSTVGPSGRGRYIERDVTPGKAAKWKAKTRPAENIGDDLKEKLEQYRAAGWEILEPVAVELRLDEYQGFWETLDKFTTPYSALRHVEAVTKKRGYRLVG